MPVLVAVIGVESVLAAIYEWEPLHACERCAFTRASHPYSHVSCPRCNDTGLVGVRRPKGPMLAIDVGWADEIHVRVIGPRTDRIGGEALHCLHTCEFVAPLHRNPRTRRYMA